MPELLNTILSPLQDFWSRLSVAQRITLVITAVGSIVAIVSIVAWANRTEYSVLFSDLDQRDAAAIVEQLRTDGVPYRLQNGGRTIQVPVEKVYEMRLQFAALGLPQSGVIGYELFDGNNIGVTDFVQKLNYKRALEGELARTIRGLDEIEGARIHIVIPEPSVFAREEKTPTASVALRLKQGVRLSQRQVSGIAHLVAASVEGLESRNVTIVDEQGNILSDNRPEDEQFTLTATQLELQEKVESYLTAKVQSLLDGVVGRNNSAVRVTAELDFDRVERTMESYDPDSQVIRSEEVSTQLSSDQSEGENRTENTITNYEINRTVERVVQTGGNVKRLSVAVTVNGRYETTEGADGEVVRKYVPRSAEEMDRLADLVRSAVGFQPERGDVVEVINLPFDLEAAPQEKPPLGLDNEEVIGLWVQRVFVALAALTILLVVRSMLRRLRSNYYSPATPDLSAIIKETAEQVPEATQMRLERQKFVTQITKDRPDEVAKLLRSWIVEGG
jgi:flagellar M-ring protein FliF